MLHFGMVAGAERKGIIHIGIMENKMEATIVYWYHIGVMGILEKKMETTIMVVPQPSPG